jgi:hypothetical protein
VATLEGKANGGMVEGFDVELHNREILPVMLFVALHALPALVERMQTSPGCHAGLNLGVALKAFLI